MQQSTAPNPCRKVSGKGTSPSKARTRRAKPTKSGADLPVVSFASDDEPGASVAEQDPVATLSTRAFGLDDSDAGEALRHRAYDIISGSRMNRDAHAISDLAEKLHKAIRNFLGTYDRTSLKQLLKLHGFSEKDWRNLDKSTRRIGNALIDDATGIEWALNFFTSIWEHPMLPEDRAVALRAYKEQVEKRKQTEQAKPADSNVISRIIGGTKKPQARCGSPKSNTAKPATATSKEVL